VTVGEAHKWYLKKPYAVRGALLIGAMIVWAGLLAAVGIPDPWFSILWCMVVVPGGIVVELIPRIQGRTGRNAR
jgi:hypothetical protein